jgi:hypothetical protein
MGEFGRISEASIRHHLPQSDYPRFGEEKPGDRRRRIKTHQTAINQTLCGRWQLRLALLGTTSPGPELKAFSDGRQGPEKWSSSRRMYSRSPGMNEVKEGATDVVMV